MILRLLCIWLIFYLLLSSLMHGTMNLKLKIYATTEIYRKFVTWNLFTRNALLFMVKLIVM
jgi:hypothetical protein